MCVVCGCSVATDDGQENGVSTTKYRKVRANHFLVSGHAHHPHHENLNAIDKVTDEHIHINPETGDLHYGIGSAQNSVPGMSQARAIRLEQDVLGENQRYADANRIMFIQQNVYSLNLVSSPGSGKTTLLCKTIELLKERNQNTHVAVIEGDQQTSNDADRIRATGAPAIQVNTGKGCHLDARMVSDASKQLFVFSEQNKQQDKMIRASSATGELNDAQSMTGNILFIENVGNLVCPAMWDLGEGAKVVILSVTEGEDKPLKYPDMFAASRLMILNKIDLLPYLQFDLARCVENARRVNPDIEVILVSAVSGVGMPEWLDWILNEQRQSRLNDSSAQTKLRMRRIQQDGHFCAH